MNEPQSQLCDWISASSPSLSEPDDNELDVGFGGPINRGLKQEEHFLFSLNQQLSTQNRAQFDSTLPPSDHQHSITQTEPNLAAPDTQMDIYRDLILRHLIQDIATTCSKLSLPTNPVLWTAVQTMSWISEMCQQFQLPIPPNLGLTGRLMMEMSPEDMRLRIPNGGDTIHAQFQLWKTAFESHTSQRKMQETEHRTYELNSTAGCDRSKQWDSGQKLDMNRRPEFEHLYGRGGMNVTPHMPSGYYPEMPQQQQQFDYSKHPFSSHYQQPFAPHSFSVNGNCDKNYFDQPTMPSPSESDISSQSSSCINDDDFKDPKFMAFPHQPQDSTPLYGPMQTVYPGLVYDNCGVNTSMHQSTPGPQLNGHVDASVGMESRNLGAPTRGSIHLWHFIRELLDRPKDYSSCVRWVNREEGTFKIESSNDLARLWGLRKNRSQMNYDKLSRSLRQYYKKGIIQKPEKKQRLVYKFLPPYNL